MHLILHIIWKDLRALRGWLLLWLVVLALPVLNGAWLVLHNPYPLSDVHRNLANIQTALVIVECVTAYVLCLQLFLQDSLSGTRQFWVTRPIGPWRLLAAKVLGAGVLFVVLPVLVSLPWWLWCGFTAGQIAFAALDLAGMFVLVTLPSAAVTVFMDAFGRALLWSLVVVGLIAVAAASFVSIPTTAEQERMRMAQVAVAVGVAVIGCAGVGVARFVCRHRLAPVAAIGVFAALGVYAARFLTLDWENVPREYHAERGADVHVTFDRFGAQSARKSGYAWQQQLTAYFDLDPGSVSTHSLNQLFRRQVWTWPDGTKLSDVRNHSAYGGSVAQLGFAWPSEDAETVEWQKRQPAWQRSEARRQVRLTTTPQRPLLVLSEFFSPGILARMEREHPSYRAEMWMMLVKPKIAVEQPLASGDWRSAYGYGLRMERVERTGDVADVLSVTTRPHLYLASFWRPYLLHLVSDDGRTPGLMPINRSRGEYVWELRATKETVPVELTANGVHISWRRHQIDGGRVIRNERWVPRPGWIDGASVVIVVPEVSSVFCRKVEVPAMTVNLPAPTVR